MAPNFNPTIVELIIMDPIKHKFSQPMPTIRSYNFRIIIWKRRTTRQNNVASHPKLLQVELLCQLTAQENR